MKRLSCCVWKLCVGVVVNVVIVTCTIFRFLNWREPLLLLIMWLSVLHILRRLVFRSSESDSRRLAREHVSDVVEVVSAMLDLDWRP